MAANQQRQGQGRTGAECRSSAHLKLVGQIGSPLILSGWWTWMLRSGRDWTRTNAR